MSEERASTDLTLAEKLDLLFKTMHSRHRGEYTYDEVAQGIRKQDGPTISPAYIWQLRNGVKDNPRKKHLEALATFFGVPPSYFFDETAGARIYAQLELLAAMRDAKIRNLAMRAFDLSPDSVRAVADLVEHLRRIQGLPNGDGNEGDGPGEKEHSHGV